MKAPELYVGDILVAIEAIDFAAHSLTQSFLAKSKALKRRSFFMPWKKDALSRELLASGNFAIAKLLHLQSIREKLMQSTGVDEDMHPVTLEEILKKNAASTN